ncbi:C-factor [mine drainage metagenome]|uniref:C-factor n=1 Tax=mine drainage metagenome TaxID=410659 RepID=A0A1J5RC16_9ZZZZ
MNAASVLIIGASRGLGLGLAAEFVARGWHVVASVRQPAQAEALRALASANPGQLAIETVDIDRREQVVALGERLAGRTFDIVFVNAGIMGPKHQRAEEATREEIGQLFTTNAIAPVALARLFLDRIRPQGGVLAFMSSRLGSVGDNVEGGTELYRASKAALNSLTRGLAAELRDRPITVLSLHPGWVRTDMGGASAPLDVATSTRGLVDVVIGRRGSRRHVFLDYSGAEIPW